MLAIKEAIMKSMRTPLAVALIALAMAGCRTMTGESAGQNIDDASITTAVKSKLASRDKVGTLTRIGVKTQNGNVYLTGVANSEAEKRQAESTAWSVKGVRSVVDDIAVAGNDQP
jgi:osmotically-inducible protein OsmY